MSGDRHTRPRFFNTSGPCAPDRHYMLPPEPRLPAARELIEQSRFFVVHAPRQTGKTTTLAALARDLTAEGRLAAVRFSRETAKIYPDDVGAAEGLVLSAIGRAARAGLRKELQPPVPWPEAEPGARLSAGLSAWAAACPLPIVLFFDEIDALVGQSMISVLSQLRDGYSARPEEPFPASVALVGLRDVRDYRIAAGANPERLGTTSPFNVAVRSLLISNFTAEQVVELYGQHTLETGQEFTPEAIELAFDYSQGQPWLVNAIAYEITGEMGVKPPEPITAAHVTEAKERLILAQSTHLLYLSTRLAEPRVKRVIQPLIAGEFVGNDPTYNDDVSYVRDLGLVGQGRPIAVANPIYREVIVRVLAEQTSDAITVDPRSFLLPDGRLDFGRLLAEFAAFWRENGEILTQGENYHEVAPQLVFMAYLQRVVNGGGYVDREYGVGRGRVDLLIRKPYTEADGKPAVQREAIELKVRRQGQGNPLKDGLAQLDEYLTRLNLDTGTLIIFDRRPSALRKRSNPQFSRLTAPSGREITLLSA